MYFKLFLLFAIYAVARATYYYYYHLRGKRYRQIYLKYLNDQDDDSHRKLSEIATQVKQLFKLAGLDKVTIAYVEPVGLGHAASGHANPADNLSNLREDIASANIKLFERAIGACKAKSIQSFNPVFWIESIIYLPTKMLSFLGIKSSNTVVRVLQIIWWLFVAVATIIGVVFNEDFINWLYNHNP